MEVKHFHTTLECSAELRSWITLNEMDPYQKDSLRFLGTFVDDDYTGVYVVFGDYPRRYCVQINNLK